MLSVEKLNEREQELTNQAQMEAQNRQNLQENIQQFQQKLMQSNTNLLILDSQIKEIQNLKLIAKQPDTTENNG